MSAWRASENFNVFDYLAQADELARSGQREEPELSDQAPQPEQLAQSEQS